MSFGDTLKTIRRSKGISQRELASKAGVDFSYISKVENDRLAPPSAETIIKLSQILDVPSELLLSKSGKVSSEIKDILSSSPEAIRFLNEARQLNLTGKEWEFLTDNLKKLR
ncbi:MAG: helix-turn-helix transcriptional regulator [Ignavibacteriales bacterium]|nr:helix-turn-helix transcriptional regulator [Ignavibacteriales bacterium]